MAGVANIPAVFPEASRLKPTPRIELPKPALIGLALGAVAATTAGTVWFEKAIYANGERRRARGVRCAHTPAATVMALATVAAALNDWTKLATIVTKG